MKRRDFLKTVVAAGTCIGSLGTLNAAQKSVNLVDHSDLVRSFDWAWQPKNERNEFAKNLTHTIEKEFLHPDSVFLGIKDKFVSRLWLCYQEFKVCVPCRSHLDANNRAISAPPLTGESIYNRDGINVVEQLYRRSKCPGTQVLAISVNKKTYFPDWKIVTVTAVFPRHYAIYRTDY